jgi:protein SCO1/2
METKKAPMSSVFKRSSSFDFDPPKPGTYDLPIIKIAPGGNVLDHNGQRLELRKILEDKISILSFVYLTCNDTEGCPLVLSNFFEIYDQSALLPELKNNVQLITISFDPSRDTVDAINAFYYPIAVDTDRSRKIQWSVLTTDNEKYLREMLDGYSQAISRNKDTNIINHIVRIYLIDKTRNVRNIYGVGTLDPRLLITDVETLMLERTQR